MKNRDAIITLSIKEAAGGDSRVFLYHIRLGGKVVAANQSLSVEDSQAVREFSKQYNGLFEGQDAPGLISDDLNVLGGQLFDVWLASAWPTIAARLRSVWRAAP